MALKCGIVGLPNVGNSTLFNCLSSANNGYDKEKTMRFFKNWTKEAVEGN